MIEILLMLFAGIVIFIVGFWIGFKFAEYQITELINNPEDYYNFD